ncbi:MAG: anaerobic ribonucleoside-triphosphate reductase activating protein, partial [Erysipelotrichaceae bacterium]|nr:anaerobic ribonucleoside-triphosphate reductase activating protein [Erysipelotrichaceae bacterium]
MNNQNNFFLNISVLYRFSNRYFDRHLSKYDIGSGQLMFLLLINEYEGISMQQLSTMVEMDKGTTTKSIQRLIDQQYVEAVTDETDKRVRRLYTTTKANEIMGDLYRIRNNCYQQIAEGIDEDLFDVQLQKATDNSRTFYDDEDNYQQMLIGGFQKLTLLDYPGKMAATVFTTGCNLKCPFCHNRDLVFIPENFEYYTPDDVLSYLKKRQGILDGVAITGGEPLLQKGLKDFIRQIRSLGLSVKLDTNGYLPDRLKDIVESGLVDYVAMDVKNCEEKYGQTVGVSSVNLKMQSIKESMQFLMEGNVDYEFRTTVVREFHNEEDLLKLAEMIK